MEKELLENLQSDTIKFTRRVLEGIRDGMGKDHWLTLSVSLEARLATNEKASREHPECTESLKSQKADLGICKVLLDLWKD